MQVSNHPLGVKGCIPEEFVEAKPSDFSSKKNKTIKIQQIPQGYLAKVVFHGLVL